MSRSNKTAHLLNLISPDQAASNPIIDGAPEKKPKRTAAELEREQSAVKKSGKHVIKSTDKLPATDTSTHNPVLRHNEENYDIGFTRYGERQLVNLTAIVLNEQLGVALNRFHACSCDKCCVEIMKRVLTDLPPEVMEISQKVSDEEICREIEKIRPEVIKSLTKVMISMRTKPIHK